VSLADGEVIATIVGILTRLHGVLGIEIERCVRYILVGSRPA
jgi:hypothetical protein